MSDNAYVQRKYPFDDEFKSSDARKQEEILRIDIHGRTEAKSMSVRYNESRPFYVFTCKEADEFLDTLRKAYMDSTAENLVDRMDHDGDGDSGDASTGKYKSYC